MYSRKRNDWNKWPNDPFEFFVLPECSHDVILGWNFLQASGVLIHCGRSELTLDDVEAAPEKEFLKPLSLCSIKDYEILTYIMKIAVQSPCGEDNVDVIVNDSKTVSFQERNFHACDTFHFEMRKTEIWVVNSQFKTKVVPQGMCVVFLKPFYIDSIAAISECNVQITS